MITRRGPIPQFIPLCGTLLAGSTGGEGTPKVARYPSRLFAITTRWIWFVPS